MNPKMIYYALCFLAGSAVGAGAFYMVTKKKEKATEDDIELRIQEEVEEVKEALKEMYESRIEKLKMDSLTKPYSESIESSVTKAREKPTIASLVERMSAPANDTYTNYSGSNVKDEPEEADGVEEPVSAVYDETAIAILSDPVEYGLNPNYKCEELTYTRDEILVDEWMKPVKNIREKIGDEALESFGIYENDRDMVYVQNDHLETYYAITKVDETLRVLNRS